MNQYEQLSELPSAIRVESSALGVVFLRDTAFYEMVAVGLKADFFHLDSHRRIFRSIERIVSRKERPSIVAVCDELEKQKELERIGGASYLSALVDGVESGDQLGQYVEILREKYLRRKTIQLGNTLIQCSVDVSDPIKFTLANVQDELLQLQSGSSDAGAEIKDFDAEVLRKLEEQMYSDQTTVGLPFGIAELDDSTTGIRETEFVPVAGIPGSGKTSFAVHVARVNAEQGTPVGVFSIEMTKEQILHRLWAQASEIPYSMLRNPKTLPRTDLVWLQRELAPRVRKWPITIDDRSKDISEIIPRSYLWIKRKGVKLIIVDFLQRIHAPGRTEYEIVSHSADALTEFAKATGVPILCLSQLSRSEDKRNAANLVPTIQQLRSSGKIEQNAHLVIFTHRPEDDNGNPTGEDMLVIGKQRAGQRGRIKAYFNGASQRWEGRK
jgi:replicative DNA helicase